MIQFLSSLCVCVSVSVSVLASCVLRVCVRERECVFVSNEALWCP